MQMLVKRQRARMSYCATIKVRQNNNATYSAVATNSTSTGAARPVVATFYIDTIPSPHKRDLTVGESMDFMSKSLRRCHG
jgi:hypothetical protein